MRLFKIQTVLALLILCPAMLWASPFLTCNPNPSAISGKYEVYEVTSAHPEGVLAYTVPSEQDGSMKLDLNGVVKGTYTFKIRYIAFGVPSTFVTCTLQSTLLEFKSTTKSFTSYAITKGWTLKVPPTTTSLVPKMVN